MEAAQAASHEHPARVLGVILGDGRGASADRRPGRHRLRLGRRDRADPAARRGGQAPRVRGAAAAAARLPGRGLVADRPPRRPGRRPARRAGPAPDHRRGRRDPGKAKAICTPVPRLPPGQHRPGLDPAHAVARAAGRGPRPAPAQGHRRRRSTAERISPSADLLVPGCATGSRSTVERKISDGPRHHRGRARDRATAPIRISAARRQAGDVSSPGQPDRPVALRRRDAARAARRGAAPARRGRRVRRRRPQRSPRAGRREVSTAPARSRSHDTADALADGGRRRAARPARRRAGRPAASPQSR